MDASQLAVLTLNGLSYGMLLFLLAAGLTVTFGLMRIVNLTHGAFYLWGGYIGLTVEQATGSFLLAVVAGALGAAALGITIQRLLLSRFSGHELSQVMLTFGCMFLLGDIALWMFGGLPQTISAPEAVRGAADVFGLRFPLYRLVLIIIGVATGAGLWWVHDHTRMGTMVRAAVHDAETARALGVSVPLLMTAVFGFGAVLAGAAGVIGGPFVGLYPGVDIEILILSVVVIIVGGLGSLRGAFLAAVLVGLLDTFGKVLFPELAQFALFAPMALTLIIRPSGLLGRA